MIIIKFRPLFMLKEGSLPTSAADTALRAAATKTLVVCFRRCAALFQLDVPSAVLALVAGILGLRCHQQRGLVDFIQLRRAQHRQTRL